MLVLSRKIDEKILLQVDGLPDPIEVTVVRIDRNKVRLGIKAEQGVTILRSELTQRPGRARCQSVGFMTEATKKQDLFVFSSPK